MAGVAPSTASLAMNNRQRVAASTRDAVLRAIEELDYVPLPGGRPRGPQRHSGRTNRVALVTPGIRRAALNAPVYMDVLHGVEAALSDAGLTMVLRHLPDEAALSGDLFPQKVDGIVLFGTTEREDVLRRLRSAPCVQMMGAVDSESPFDHVTYTNARIGPLACDFLHSRGHRHVAVVSWGGVAPTFTERRCGFLSAWRALGIGSAMDIRKPGLFVYDGATQRTDPRQVRGLMEELLAMDPRPTALFLVIDMLAPVIQAELLRRGLNPGQDIDLVACNNERILLAPMHPRPATIDIHAEVVGRRAVEQLIWRLEHRDAPRQVTQLDPELVPGE
jgi:DNA-binding LacI/PurR family transcriptional regulator